MQSSERLHCNSIVHIKTLMAPSQSPSQCMLALQTVTAQDVPSQSTMYSYASYSKMKNLNIF